MTPPPTSSCKFPNIEQGCSFARWATGRRSLSLSCVRRVSLRVHRRRRSPGVAWRRIARHQGYSVQFASDRINRIFIQIRSLTKLCQNSSECCKNSLEFRNLRKPWHSPTKIGAKFDGHWKNREHFVEFQNRKLATTFDDILLRFSALRGAKVWQFCRARKNADKWVFTTI